MFCTSCGYSYTDGMKFCPNCGKSLIPGVVPVSNSPAVKGPEKVVELPPVPKCEDPEEEAFYQANRYTIKGLESYCTRYPEGFYYRKAQSAIYDMKESKESSRRVTMKIVKTIILIILCPIILLGKGMYFKAFNLSRLQNWYQSDEWF